RFKVEETPMDFNLKISNIQSTGVAAYYCRAFWYGLLIFGNGTLLLLKRSKSITRSVVQQPPFVSVQTGDDVTLQCIIHTENCAGEHNVYWFRHGSGESLLGIIYTHGNQSAQCERSSVAGFSTQSCVYNLPKRNFSLSDAGTYYCAVATCGEILFGNGTLLEITDSNTLLRILTPLKVIVSVHIFLSFKKKIKSWCKNKIESYLLSCLIQKYYNHTH
uniref:Ig-like domain-containing protein n=1 Tax=Lepisosteus oculatus TaxID=7918 RepID=W5MYW6_LEPOC